MNTGNSVCGNVRIVASPRWQTRPQYWAAVRKHFLRISEYRRLLREYEDAESVDVADDEVSDLEESVYA